jgi:hypothetical protein
MPFEKVGANDEGAVQLAAPEFPAMSDDLKGCSLADVLEKLEKGRIGHRAAMEWLGVALRPPGGHHARQWAADARTPADGRESVNPNPAPPNLSDGRSAETERKARPTEGAGLTTNR